MTAVFTYDPPPYFDSHVASTSHIKEVVESHILQVKEATTPDEEQDQDFSHNIFKVFATEKKKRRDKASIAAELSAPPPMTPAPAVTSSTSWPNVQYRYQCDMEDQQLVSELEEYFMQGKLSLTTPAHILAASLPICKSITEKLKVRCVETNKYKIVPAAGLPSLPP